VLFLFGWNAGFTWYVSTVTAAIGMGVILLAACCTSSPSSVSRRRSSFPPTPCIFWSSAARGCMGGSTRRPLAWRPAPLPEPSSISHAPEPIG
jgi:hypothetical protein